MIQKYPSLSICGTLGATASSASDLFSSSFISGLINLSLPFLDWNRVKWNVKIAEADYEDGCFLFFGRETTGLPEEFLDAHYESCVRIPMREEARSLNLSNSVAVGVFEALRQQSFPHLKTEGKMAEWKP